MADTHPPLVGTYALPPPSFLAQPYSGVPRLPPPAYLSPISIPSAAPPRTEISVYQPQHFQPPSPYRYLASTSHERWSSAPADRHVQPQAYATFVQEPSYIPQQTARPLGRTELEYKPSRPLRETSAGDGKRYNVSQLISPVYATHRGSEDSYRSSATSSISYEPSSRAEPAVSPQEMPPKNSSDCFEIRVRQQPLAARACGFGERDRRVIDPPPIVQLIIKDPKSGEASPSELRYPFNVVHCTLWNAEGTTDETALTQADRRTTRRLMGTLVSSPFVGVDENDQEGCFFCFPDLSCRTHGRYRLSFVLMRLQVTDLQPGGFTPIHTQTLSDVFTVFTAKDFPGMRASTALTKALKRQGCAISVKKGNEKAVHARDEDSGEDDVAEAQVTGGRVKRRRKD
ncbi:MAG: hypothetical protein M1827_002624 [Pycnora praestabilis]|nr:MAG: hypothetical protein M1827_002624 [Pycnora praestabilis]